MENPWQLILIASSSKGKPLHSLSEFCQQSLLNVTRQSTSFCFLSAMFLDSRAFMFQWLFPCLDQSPWTLRNSAETPVHNKYIVWTHRKYKPVGLRRYSPFRAILRYRFLKYYNHANGCWIIKWIMTAVTQQRNEDAGSELRQCHRILLTCSIKPRPDWAPSNVSSRSWTVARRQGIRPIRISTCFYFHYRERDRQTERDRDRQTMCLTIIHFLSYC